LVLLMTNSSSITPSCISTRAMASGSPQFGFPPVVAGAFIKDEVRVRLAEALLGMDREPEGRRLLDLLHLDRFMTPREDIYDGIAAMIQSVIPVVE
jgi:phosphonate transport system substrate-binding protein